MSIKIVKLDFNLNIFNFMLKHFIANYFILLVCRILKFIKQISYNYKKKKQNLILISEIFMKPIKAYFIIVIIVI